MYKIIAEDPNWHDKPFKTVCINFESEFLADQVAKFLNGSLNRGGNFLYRAVDQEYMGETNV